jgi:pyruvate dehydrogenase E2 component (dihydrolipoamide acetyltransferase)
MTHILKMPKLSDTMKEGVLVKWLISEGEAIQRGDPLLEVETDKATMEIESPQKGFLLKVFFQPTDRVPLGANLAVIGKKDENWESILEEKIDESLKKPSLEKPISSPKIPPPHQVSNRSLKASPYAKKVAQNEGVDLNNIQGTGPQGRILARDVLKEASSSGKNQEKTTVQTLTPMRETIARRLQESVRTIPHFYLKVIINPQNLIKLKKEHQAYKVTINDTMNYFVAKVIRHHPLIRSTFENQKIITANRFHLSFALSVPDGLITPVIFDADQLSLPELSQKTKKIIQKGKEKKLTVQELTSGHFTTSNLGNLGIAEFTSIINPPQVAILSIGALSETDQKMIVTLGCDHRVIDGSIGALFLKDLKETIENPLFLTKFI